MDEFVILNNPFRYRGYYYDIETNLFLVTSLYYSPELGRFIQPADVSTLNSSSINGLNLYSYANNNPIGITYSSFSHEVATSVPMLNAVRKTSLSLNGNVLNSSFGFDLDFIPAITIKGKTPEEWLKYWINSWFE